LIGSGAALLGQKAKGKGQRERQKAKGKRQKAKGKSGVVRCALFIQIAAGAGAETSLLP
jgi:hypothetical protein